MNPDRLNELALLNAAGALDGRDLEELQALLAAADPATRAQVAAGNDLAGLLSLSAPPARTLPPGLKPKLLSLLRERSTRKPARFRPGFFFLRGNEGEWKQHAVPGVRYKQLSSTGPAGYDMVLYELAPSTHFPSHHHAGAEECYILSGDFQVEGATLRAGDFHHAESHSDHGESYTEHGCQLLIVAAAGDYR